MNFCYSPSTGLFYQRHMNPDIPEDAVDLDNDLFGSLVGFDVVPDHDGMPRATGERAKEWYYGRVANKRWLVETGGIEVNGIKIDTSEASMNKIANAVGNAAKAGITVVDFKSYDDSGMPVFSQLEIAQLGVIAGLIGQHQAACFTAEKLHVEAIRAATDEELLSYDLNLGWPGQLGAAEEGA